MWTHTRMIDNIGARARQKQIFDTCTATAKEKSALGGCRAFDRSKEDRTRPKTLIGLCIGASWLG